MEDRRTDIARTRAREHTHTHARTNSQQRPPITSFPDEGGKGRPETSDYCSIFTRLAVREYFIAEFHPHNILALLLQEQNDLYSTEEHTGLFSKCLLRESEFIYRRYRPK
jgi:hypothetical protein